VTPASTLKPTPIDSAQPTPAPTPDDLVAPSLAPRPQATDGASIGTIRAGTPEPTRGPAGESAIGMRVVDRRSTDGLLETIVGGVTGFFFGG
jgi:hypothetical protein